MLNIKLCGVLVLWTGQLRRVVEKTPPESFRGKGV